MSKLLQALFAFVPLLFTPVLILLLAEDFVDLGGGEKDIVLAFPWAVWSLIFGIVGLVLVIRGWPFRRWVGRSTIIATGCLIVLGIIAYLTSYLGLG